MPAVALALLALSWGTIPLILRSVDLPDIQVAAVRVALGALVGAVLVRAQGGLSIPSPLRSRVVLLGVLLAVHWTAFFYAITHTTVAVALIVVFLAPLLWTGLGTFVLKERPAPRSVAALVVGLVGTAMVAWGEIAASPAGVAAGVFAAVTFAVLIVLGKPVAQELGGLRLATLQLMVAAVALAPWLVSAVVDLPWEPVSRANAGEFLWQLLVLGTVLTGLSAIAYWWTVTRLPVANVGILSYLEPASAVVWAALFLGEQPGALGWAGVFLVLAAGVSAVGASAQVSQPVGRA